MPNVVFITTHLFSGSNTFINSLNVSERIDIRHPHLSYDHPEVLLQLFQLGHKLNNRAAIYGDELLFNKDFSSKAFYSFAKFIYFIHSPKDVLTEMLTNVKNISAVGACRYYCFRLRRIYEMAVKTPGAVFLTLDEFLNGKGDSLIEEYLGLVDNLNFKETSKQNVLEKNIPYNILLEAEKCYEKYFYCLKNINLLKL